MDKSIVQLKSQKAAVQPPQNGFERGLVAEKIIGASVVNGIVYYLVKWTDCWLDDSEFITSEVAKAKIPLMVIAFLEQRLRYYEHSTSSC